MFGSIALEKGSHSTGRKVNPSEFGVVCVCWSGGRKEVKY